MKKRITTFFLTFSLVVCTALCSYATHIIGGYISLKKLEGNHTWEITLVRYHDNNSPVANPRATIHLGDGSPAKNIPYTSYIFLEEFNTVEYKYTTTHTYPGPGRYTVFHFEQNRNSLVRNIQNPDFNTFYIETELIIDPSLPMLGTPVPQTPLLSIARQGRRFTYNPNSLDPDGDSISYRIVTPRQYVLPDGPVLPVTGYQSPATGGIREDGSLPAEFSMHPATGELVWDAPQANGQYTIAFEVVKWRLVPNRNQYEEVGYVVYDMLITVREEVVTNLHLHEVNTTQQLSLFPNPTDGFTNIELVLAEKSEVSIAIYNLTGSKVAAVANATLVAGGHTFTYDTRQLKPGMYVCQIETSTGKTSRKLVVQ
jgi:hypothetical protein